MTTMVTESQGITVGTRVRMVDPSGAYQDIPVGTEGTVEQVDGNIRRVRFENGVTRRLYARRLQAIATPVVLGPGVRVRIANPAYTRPDGSGFVNAEFYGAEAVIVEPYGGGSPDNWWVQLPEGDRNHIHESCLTPIGQAAPAAPLPLSEGARVRVTVDGAAVEGTVITMPCGGGCCPGTFQADSGIEHNLNDSAVVLPPDPNTPTPQREEVQVGDVVRYDDSEWRVERLYPYISGATMYYDPNPRGDARYEMVRITRPDSEQDVYTRQVEFIRHDSSPIPGPQPQYGVSVGTRVRCPGLFQGEGVVVEKTRPAASAAHMRSANHSQVRQPNGTMLMVNNVNLMPVPDVDLDALTVEEKLDRLQRMIHRVASYEAQRRNWCNEVNTALAALDGLLPPELLQVDRELGNRLVNNPTTLFLLDDGHIPPPAGSTVDEEDEEDDHYECDTYCEECYPLVTRTFTVRLSVDYDTNMGWSVSGAGVSVSVSTSDWYESYEPDPSEMADLISTEQIRDALLTDSSVPDPASGMYWLNDSDIEDWDEN